MPKWAREVWRLGGHLHVYCGCGERACGFKRQPGNIKEDGFENQIISDLETFP